MYGAAGGARQLPGPERCGTGRYRSGRRQQTSGFLCYDLWFGPAGEETSADGLGGAANTLTVGCHRRSVDRNASPVCGLLLLTDGGAGNSSGQGQPAPPNQQRYLPHTTRSRATAVSSSAASSSGFDQR